METYMVIQMVRLCSKERKYNINSARVYNCKTKSWKRIKYFQYQLIMNGQGAYLDGVPHWIVARKHCEGAYVIIYFDAKEDAVKEVKPCLPPWLVKGAKFRFGVLEESLCLVNIFRVVADVWVMKECWSKLFKIVSRIPVALYNDYTYNIFDKIMEDLKPFYRRKCNEVWCEIVKEKDCDPAVYKVCVYRSTNQADVDEIFAFEGPCNDNVFDQVTYAESLVSPRFAYNITSH